MKSLLVSLALLAAPLAAQATTIDFSGLAGGSIDQTYGDVAGVVDVTYDYSFDNGASYTQGGTVWSGDYYTGPTTSGNALIAPAAGASIMRITIEALGGNFINDFGAMLAYWSSFNGWPLTISLFGDGVQTFSTDNTVFPGLNGVGSFGQNWTKVSFELGADWNVGYASVSYELASNVAPVPLPAAGLMLAGALAGLAGLRRRKAAAV